jgi:hypothetical protein
MVKVLATITTGLLCGMVLVLAVPPMPTSRADLIKRSDLIAIVTLTNVTDAVSVEIASTSGQRQSATALVDRTIKGTAPQMLHLTLEGPPLSLSCRPPSLSTGRFLVFLRREGDGYVRTDTWYSQLPIITNHVSFSFGRPVRLETAIREIERTTKRR